jgi:hypothetical protein
MTPVKREPARQRLPFIWNAGNGRTKRCRSGDSRFSEYALQRALPLGRDFIAEGLWAGRAFHFVGHNDSFSDLLH